MKKLIIIAVAAVLFASCEKEEAPVLKETPVVMGSVFLYESVGAQAIIDSGLFNNSVEYYIDDVNYGSMPMDSAWLGTLTCDNVGAHHKMITLPVGSHELKLVYKYPSTKPDVKGKLIIKEGCITAPVKVN